jgi:hypothetical protein
MPLADKNYTFHLIPTPGWYKRLSRGQRAVLELTIGLLILSLMGIGASVAMPRWLLALGWAVLVVYWGYCCVVYLKIWIRRQHHRR